MLLETTWLFLNRTASSETSSLQRDLDQFVRDGEGPTLEEEELLPIPGEFDVHRPPVSRLQFPKDLPHKGDKRRAGEEIVERDAPFLHIDLLYFEERRGKPPVLIDGKGEETVVGTDEVHHLFEGMGFDGAGFQIHQFDHPLGILHDLADARLGAQLRMAQGNQAGISLSDPIDGRRPQAENEADDSFFLADSQRPAVGVVGERHSGGEGEEVIAEAASDHLLHQNAHLLVVVEELVVAPIEDGGLGKGAHVDLLQSPDERGEASLDVPLIGDENRVVLPGKGKTEVVFQKARRAEDQWVFAHGNKEFPEHLHDIFRKGGLGEYLTDVAVVLLDRLVGIVFLAVKTVEPIVIGEIRKDPRVEIVGFGDGHVFFQVGVALQEARKQDLVGKQEARRLPPDLPRPAGRREAAREQLVDIPYREIVVWRCR